MEEESLCSGAVTGGGKGGSLCADAVADGGKEENLDFDAIVDRRNTDCLKYDSARRRGKPEGILPLWVADMDFRTSSLVLEKVMERVRHGIFGYTEPGDSYDEAVIGWMRRRHGLDARREWIVKTPGVVFALAMAVRAFTERGDSVLIQQPVYYPFREVIEANGRKAVSSDLVLGEDGRYRIDFGDLERKVAESHARLFLLCSPHNPVGRVWDREELREVARICRRHHVVVASDEIHEDFVYPGFTHTPLPNADEGILDQALVCTSPSKSFNLAGLQVSNIFIPNGRLRAAFRAQVAATGYSQLNAVGLVACEAAYRYGEEWLDAVREYLLGNLSFLRERLRERLPGIRLVEPEGTYLAWLDFRGLALDEGELEERIVGKAGLWLDRGPLFGKSGEGFQRINLATSRKVLGEALSRLEGALREEEPS